MLRYSMMKLVKEFEISTGHRLPNHKGGCYNIHGHNYWVYIEIGFNIPDRYIEGKEGFLIDFGDVKRIINDTFDHKFIAYEKDPFANILEDLPGVVFVEYIPTAENMSLHMRNLIKDHLQKNGIKAVVNVQLNETKFSKVSR